MSNDLRALLDRLDTALAAATRGEWVHNPINGIHTPIGACIATTHKHDDEKRRADAALIVAAVNALPDLLAAVRAVGDLADNLDALVDDETVDETARIAHAWTLHRLRAALALTDGATR